MVAKLTPEEQRNFVGFISNLAKGDGARAGRCLLRFSAAQTCRGEVATGRFVRDVQLLFARTCRGYGTGTQVGEVLRATLALVRRHGVRVDANYATLILNILCLDGLAQGLVPEYNVVDGAHALLAFHDRVKRLPGGARAARLLLPLGQALKARQDRRFFRRLLRAQRREEEDLLRGALEEEGGGGGGGEEEDSDDEGPVYNPLNLPLGWDGKPIPYWLYKLHGLGVEFKCEVCGGASYMGRRAFDRHFQEWRHAHGMRCLGIPNTKHFHDITTIEDAKALYAKLKAGLDGDAWDGAVEEEYEDSEGNVLNRRTYEDLARQGLL
mmetsp:Transcript_12242/g.19681  ORF Transcript_12242/g.19681 Transcript_12242/m.19681 type:complete len:324 (+) Transcript_12242:178-1149(+)